MENEFYPVIVEVEITDMDRLKLSVKLGKLEGERRKVKQQAQLAAAEYKSREKIALTGIEEILSILEAETIEKEIPCRSDYRYNENTVFFYDEIGNCVFSRKITDEERQLKLSGVKNK